MAGVTGPLHWLVHPLWMCHRNSLSWKPVLLQIYQPHPFPWHGRFGLVRKCHRFKWLSQYQRLFSCQWRQWRKWSLPVLHFRRHLDSARVYKDGGSWWLHEISLCSWYDEYSEKLRNYQGSLSSCKTKEKSECAPKTWCPSGSYKWIRVVCQKTWLNDHLEFMPSALSIWTSPIHAFMQANSLANLWCQWQVPLYAFAFQAFLWTGVSLPLCKISVEKFLQAV